MSRSSQILLVTFDPSTGIDPLTVTAKQLVDSVELYLQRVAPGELTIRVAEDADYGLAHQRGRLVSHFTFAPLGGAR
jgi:hypothetical protein